MSSAVPVTAPAAAPVEQRAAPVEKRAADNTADDSSSMIFWIIIVAVIAIGLFFFGPMIMNMFNGGSSNRFGGEEIGVKTVTDLLSNT